MGTDKARLPGGVLHLITVLEGAGLDAHVIRRGVEPDGWLAGVKVVVEATEGERHPLRGVLTALDDAGEDVVVVPCDTPRLTIDDVKTLVKAGPCVAAPSDDPSAIHPLVGVVPLSLREAVEAAIAGSASARSVMRGLRVVVLPTERLFDRNTPADCGDTGKAPTAL